MENDSHISSSSLQSNKNILFLNKCRLCLDKEGYAVISDLSDLCNNIYTLMGIKIQETDDLPNKICESCIKTIVDFVDLKSKAIKYQVYLRSVLGDSTTKEVNIVDSTNNIEEDTEDLITFDGLQTSNVAFLSVRKDLYELPPTNIKEEENNPKEIKPGIHDCEFKCSICSKTFKTRKQRMLHQRSHNKIFLCPIHICGKKFATKGDLEKHIRSHTGERPFQCDECKKSFAQRVTLKAHKISIHNMAT